jgi:hypothetical protein
MRKAKENRNRRKNEKFNLLIKNLKNKVKNEESFLKKCKEYGKDPNFLDNIHVSFEPLDVSAKTVNEKIFLNENLLKGDEEEQIRYIIHEAVHVMQQESGKVNGKPNKDYLDDPNEQEAFKTQVSYMSDHEDPEEVQNYIEHLLDHHDIEGKERKEKKEKLLEDV